ncbi:MAG: PCRF domain-containing protein, partial [Alcanivoracaceae bacterium]
MKDSLRHKLDRVSDRYDELSALLSDAEVISDQNRFRDLSREYAELEPVVKCFNHWRDTRDNLDAALAMQDDDDPDMRAMGQDEAGAAGAELEQLEDELQKLMLPRDPRDRCNVFLEIRAGTGGDEAAIFAG